jgi:hypothetical protein
MAIDALNNGVSLYRELYTYKFKLKSAIARSHLMQAISDWKLPIISDIALDIKKYNVEAINTILAEQAVLETEQYIKAKFIANSTLQINHIQIPLQDQNYSCIEINLNCHAAYYCYDSTHQDLKLFAYGQDACILAEYL